MKKARLSQTLIVSGVVALCSGVAQGAIRQHQVLLLHHATNPTSLAIRDAYVATYPGVKVLALDIPYDNNPPHVVNPECNTNPCNGHADHPCCACPYLVDGEAANERYITPGMYETHIRQEVLDFLAEPENEGVLAIVTTKGLPTAITRGFVAPATHSRSCVLESVEAALSHAGYPGTYVPTPNPYYQKLGVSFQDFLDTDNACSIGGPTHAGKLFMVSRLDSSDLDSYCNQSTCLNSYNSVDEIVALIGRSAELIVNKRAVTLVVDDAVTGAAYHDPRFGYYMQQRDWCVYFDQTCKFLHGPLTAIDDPTCGSYPPGCGKYEKLVEGVFENYPEIVRVTMGRNHRIWSSEAVCVDYITKYAPHPAGLFLSIESYNGLQIREPCSCGSGGGDWNHGNVLDWIAAGGSFSAGYLVGPSGGGPLVDSNYIVANLFEHGLSWGEAILSGTQLLNSTMVPIGDPLARVIVVDPDVNGDGVVNEIDLNLVQSGDVDLNGDGVTNAKDLALVEEALGRECDYPAPPASTWPVTSIVGGFPRCGDINNNRAITSLDYDLLSAAIGTPAALCPRGDLDLDGWVTLTDLQILNENLGRCRGDVNGDCLVNIDDMMAVINAWCNGTCDCSNSPGFQYAADMNCDCLINSADLSIVIMDMNQNCPAPCPP